MKIILEMTSAKVQMTAQLLAHRELLDKAREDAELTAQIAARVR